ncbi:Cell surface glycoprotein MUC18, partial [Nibea albiflora]
WADIEVNTEDRVEVFRGDTAQITCMFTSSEGIGAMVIQWFYVTWLGEKQRLYYQDSTTKFPERGTPFTDRISLNDTGVPGEVVLTIDNVQLTDELEFICLVKSLTEAAGEGRTKLKVFETPDLPTIQGVQTGISVNDEDLSRIGSCLVTNGYPKPNITWYRNSTPLRNIDNEVKVMPSSTSESTGLYTVSSKLNMKVVKANKDDQFYCEITYFVPGGTRMTETSRINITVLYPSTEVNIWVDSPKGKIKEGDTIQLHCQGNGNSELEVITISHEQTGISLEDKTLELHNVTRLHSGQYRCGIVDLGTLDNNEEIHGNTSVFVNYLDPPVVMPKDTILVTQGEELKATCNALSSLQTDTTWFKNGKMVTKGHSLMLKDATFDTAGKYVCVVTVPEIEGMEASEVLHVKVQGPPKIMEQEHTDLEESVSNTVDLSCNVRGFPAPSVIWTTSDGKIIETATKEETEEGVHSVVSIEVTSDITAFCNATNEYGTDAVTFAIKAREGRGVIIAVIIICILLLAILGSTLYFLYKKGKICGRSGKQDLTKEKSSKDNIVVEMKSDNTEEAVLLEVNGEKRPPSDQAQTSRCLQASTTARLAQSYVMEKLSCLSVNIMMDGRDSNYSKLQLLLPRLLHPRKPLL